MTTKTTYPRKRLASRKRPAARPYKLYDPITNYLPESLVTDNILSRLPTKDVVRTSVLSKAWQHIWTSSCHVSISDGDIPRPDEQEKISFINAMNKIILDHPTPNHLRSFRLSVSSNFKDQTTIRTWISAVILRHKLEHLEIDLSVQGNVYPSCLLNSTSLRILWLRHYHSTLCVGGKNLAPNLTTLYISYVKINVNGNPDSSTVKFDFPVLENFTLFYVQWMNVKSVEIRAPSLTTFTSGLMPSSYWDHEFTIKMVSPRLTRFVCFHGVPEVFITKRSSSLVSAVLLYGDCDDKTLDVRQTIGLRVNKLVSRFTSLEELDLSDFAAEALLSGPRFHAKLVTTLRLHDRGSAEQLLALLHAMPSLKFLVVNVCKWNEYDYEAMASVPSCIVSQLEEVVLRLFEAKVPQYDLASFLLENANKLKKLTVVTDMYNSREPLSAVGQHLSTLARRSQMLETDARAFLGRTEFGSYPSFL